MKTPLTILMLLMVIETSAQITPYEKSGKKETATYDQAIAHYTLLAKTYPQARLLSYGSTDFGQPLHLLVLSKDKVFDPLAIKKADKRVLLINNGIHPGEPEGIDASMMLSRDLLKNNQLPKDVVICIIPVYNIDGSFNRSSTSRANQNGPLAYGFRGNSKNYDLNRDFIKSDSKNSLAFQQIFNTWQPEIFVDTHTSNGADYQYTMTLIPTHKDKMTPVLANYLNKTMLPSLYEKMAAVGYEMTPYVNSVEETPDAGITGFLESPRYSTGYTTLHNTIGFMPETHMLKDFEKRVDATYKLLQIYIDVVARDAKLIGQNKRAADQEVSKQSSFAVDWKLNNNEFETFNFKGFAAKYKPSEVSGLDRLYYDRNEPYEKPIKYWNTFDASTIVNKPIAYIIPKAWSKVVDLLKLNNVKVSTLAADQTITAELYYFKDYKTSTKPYEGHYLHSGVKLSPVVESLPYYKGDFVVFVDQATNRYIVETLEPQAMDSFFNWNFFDSILSMKEHFSAYVFEDTAAELIKKDPQLKKKLDEEKTKNPDLAKSADAQLDFIYKNSSYFEKTYSRYPVARMLKDTKLTLK